MAYSLISRIGSGSAEATTITIPGTYQAGDIIIIFAFRDGSTTNASVPAGWNTLTITTDGTSCSSSAGWKIAASGAETSGTWTNATGLICHVYRGADPISPFGVQTATPTPSLTANAGTTSPSTYGATTGPNMGRMDNQWFVAVQFHRSTDTTTMNNAPTGYTNVINAQSGVTQNMVSFDTDGPVEAGFASNTVAPGGTASGWQTLQLPIYPAMYRTNNYQFARCVSAGVISLGEKLR